MSDIQLETQLVTYALKDPYMEKQYLCKGLRIFRHLDMYGFRFSAEHIELPFSFRGFISGSMDKVEPSILLNLHFDVPIVLAETRAFLPKIVEGTVFSELCYADQINEHGKVLIFQGATLRPLLLYNNLELIEKLEEQRKLREEYNRIYL